MNNYEIQSQKLNPNKVFILQKSELEKSFSPLYHSSLPKKLAHAKKLKEIAIVNPTRPRPKFESNEIVPYVGLPETDEHSKSIVEVAMRPYKEVAGRNVIYPNELLFARIEPSVFNKKYILTEDLKGHQFAFTSTEFYVVKGKNVSNKFLMAAFHSDYVFNQIEGKTTGSTGRRRLDPEVFENLIIPIPEIEKQKKIETIYNSVVEQKKQNELESEKLLSSIDDYLLKALGIELPKTPENTLQNRIFTTSIKEISGGRFDPQFYLKEYKDLCDKIKTQKHKRLGDIVKFSSETWNQKDFFADTFPYIEISEIDTLSGEIQNISIIEKEKAPSRAKMIVRKNDIIVSTTRPNRGAVSLIKDKQDFSIASTGFSVIREIKDNEVNREFLFTILKQQLSLKQFEQRSSGGNYPAITQEELSNVFIPIPPIEKQKEIADHITTIRNQAHQLTDKTNEAMKKASEEIEKILLQ